MTTFLTGLVVWILKSVFLYVIFHFGVMTALNAFFRVSIIKVIAVLIFAVLSGTLMAWLKYVPWLLLFALLISCKYTLDAMGEPKFISESGLLINHKSFAFFGYGYILLSCILAWLFQIETYMVIDGDLVSQGMLWQKWISWK